MSAARKTTDGHSGKSCSIDAAGLLSQQIWCWGCDILRAEGNWLVEIGFDRLESPPDRENESSVYSLEFGDRNVVLRGFGVFYGDNQLGGIFLHRFEFAPKYLPEAKLTCPPWSNSDLPSMSAPTDSQRTACTSLLLDLIDWIRSYEVNILEQLGIEYRRSTLLEWNNGVRPYTPAEQIASSWRELSLQVAANLKPN